MRRIQSTCLTSHNQHQNFKSKTPFHIQQKTQTRSRTWKMERERERGRDLLHLGYNIATEKGRERYGHNDGKVDSPVKIQAWFRALMRRCSSNTDSLLRLGSVFEHRLWCHGASSLEMSIGK